MKVSNVKGVKILVATNGGFDAKEQCPRVVLGKANASFRDDYHGKLSVRGKITKKLFGF